MSVDIIEPYTPSLMKRPRETIDLSPGSVSKCGELFVTNTADRWIFFCSYCNKASNDIGIFICHIRSEHLRDLPALVQQQRKEIQNTPAEKTTNVSTQIVPLLQHETNLSDSPLPTIQIAGLPKEDDDAHNQQHLTEINIIKEEQFAVNNQETTEKTICSKLTKIVDVTSVTLPEKNETDNFTAEQNSLCTTNTPSCGKIQEEFFTITLSDDETLEKQEQSTLQIPEANSNHKNPEYFGNSDTISCNSSNQGDNNIDGVGNDYDIGPGASGRSQQRSRKEVQNDLYPFTCKYCQQCFKTKQGMFNHISFLHSKQLPFKCKKCERSFNSRSGLRMHTRSHEENNFFICPICNSKHMDYYFIGHVLTHESDTCFPCQVCGKIYDTNEKRMEHWESHAKEKPYSCKFCYRRFRKQHVLIHHLKSHYQYHCNFCPDSFISMDFQRPPYICPKCEKLPDIKEKAEYQRTIGDNSHVFESDEDSNQDLNELTADSSKEDSQTIGSTTQNQEINDIGDTNVDSDLEFIDETKDNDNAETNQNGKYACRHCSNIYYSEPGLAAHITKSHNQNCHQKFFHKCPYCKKNYNTKAGLYYHKKRYHRREL